MKTSHHFRHPVRLRAGHLALASSLFLTAVLAGAAAAADQPKAVDAPVVKGDASEAVKNDTAKRGRLISFVVLLKEPRKLDEVTLGATVSKAVGIARDPDTVDKGFMIAKPPHYKVELTSGMYVINNISEPYFENSDKLVKEIDDPELQRAVIANKAWISIDWVGKEEPADLKTAYRDMGKIAAALAQPDALAIYSPEEGQLSVYNESVGTAMKGDDPLMIFDGASDHTVSVSDNDPRMKEAQQKARKAWPEFARAYQAKAGTNFAVIGRIVEGDDSEYMWLSVTSIDKNNVHGTLDNAPVALTKLKIGQDLHVNINEVDDWIYIGTDNVPVGGFTKEALIHARDSAKADTK